MEPALRQVPKSAPKTLKNAERAEVVRSNIRWLLRSACLSQRVAAEEIGVRYKWMRRICHHGLAWSDRRTAASLDKLAEFFGVTTDSLWSTSLHDHLPTPSHHVLIKWIGSKRKQAASIVAQFPGRIDTYYEPFVGSGAVLYRLLSSDIKVKRFRCSDLCQPLIDVWKTVVQEPRQLASRYEEMWRDLQRGGKRFYFEVRQRFNESSDPCDFFFLLRTCRLGIVRFNRRGQFMVPYHLGEDGLPPEATKKLIAKWHHLLRSREVQFTVRDFSTIKSKAGDFLYLDPPYRSGRCCLYFGRFDHGQLFNWLAQQRGRYALSLNGFVGERDRRIGVPPELFDEQLLLENGTSAMHRMSLSPDVRLQDSLYLRLKQETRSF
jgi:DNA adenine methylase